mmetsp:Transcript_8846/g.26595  ORF Transcript_8846/g.26595 Transcript_8846/m.26595 type:complete len:249 (-) Transcript_8846:665-1411(-)
MGQALRAPGRARAEDLQQPHAAQGRLRADRRARQGHHHVRVRPHGLRREPSGPRAHLPAVRRHPAHPARLPRLRRDLRHERHGRGRQDHRKVGGAGHLARGARARVGAQVPRGHARPRRRAAHVPAARHGVRAGDRRLRRAHRGERLRLRGQGLGVLRHARLRGRGLRLRQARARVRGQRRVRGAHGRGRGQIGGHDVVQAGPEGLCALEGLETGRAHLGVALGQGPARLAHRVQRHDRAHDRLRRRD